MGEEEEDDGVVGLTELWFCGGAEEGRKCVEDIELKGMGVGGRSIGE